MRLFLTWLLALGLIAGLGERVLAAAQTEHHCEAKQECCPSGHSGCSHSGDQKHDEKCPADHHHCGTCLHQIPLGVESDLISRLPVPEVSRLEIRPQSERVPDGPFQALDKPPLI